MPTARLFPPSPESTSPWATRILAALLHLGLSVVVAAFTALLVFWLWYPTPFREISGGRDLFLLVVAVDVVIGPMLTAVVFDTRKPRSELLRDLAVIVFVQLAALAYGTHSVAQARPVVLALEVDRLRVVRAIDLANANWASAPQGLEVTIFSGPIVVATRAPSPAEKNDAVFRGLSGEDVGMRPEFWLPEAQTPAAYASAAMPVERLRSLNAKHLAELEAAIAGVVGSAQATSNLGYLPILARRADWSALVDRSTGRIVGYVPFEGF